MKRGVVKIVGVVFLPLIVLTAFVLNRPGITDDRFISHSVDLKKDELKFYWKNDKGEVIGNFANLKIYAEGKSKSLEFAMNGGMYMENQAPLGLYIEI